MRIKIPKEIDKAITEACRVIGFKYVVPPEVIKDTDAYLDEVIQLVRPVRDGPRDVIKQRIGTLRKNKKMYTVGEVLAQKRLLDNQ